MCIAIKKKAYANQLHRLHRNKYSIIRKGVLNYIRRSICTPIMETTENPRKRFNEEEDETTVKKMKTDAAGFHSATVPRFSSQAPTPPPADDKNLSSAQITVMMANAQREIEERKKALTVLKDKEPANQEDVERAKKIAMLQAQIRAKLSGTLSAIIPPIQEKPKPLILDDQGRTVDNSGRAISMPTLAPTLKANMRVKKKDKTTKPAQSNEHGTEEHGSRFFDDRISVKPMQRTRRTLRFHEPGKFQQMGEKIRMRQQLNKLQNEISQIARKTGISSATKLALIAPKQDSHAEDVPQMEWWDSVILSTDLGTTDEENNIAIRDKVITNLIEHPTQMKAPSEYLTISIACNFSSYSFYVINLSPPR